MSKDSAPTTSKTNILKCRDDRIPVQFAVRDIVDPRLTTPEFAITEGPCSWAKPEDSFGPERIRRRLEPWLTALCQSEHLSLFLGSGLPNAVYRLANGGKVLAGMGTWDFGEHDVLINEEAKRTATAGERDAPNIEDQIRIANELIRSFELVGLLDESYLPKAEALRQRLTEVMTSFTNDILRGENGVISADPENRDLAFNYLVSFIMSFASRSGTRDRLHIFTTNYDRFIEAGAEAAGLHLIDRFVGSVSPIFRSSRLDLDIHYNPPGIRGEPRYLEGVARFTKLHGSLDWVDIGRTIRRLGVPFGSLNLAPFMKLPGTTELDAMRVMIYPNAAKERETASYPYVELYRDFAAAICRPNHTLFTFGYGFGDEQLNRVIEDMLTIPSTHLVVISHSDSLGRIMRTYKRLGRFAQITLMIGTHIGDFQSVIDYYLPKPAIDRTTFRMAELLKSRHGTNSDETERERVSPEVDREEVQ